MTDRYETVVVDNGGVLIEPTDAEISVDTVVDSFRRYQALSISLAEQAHVQEDVSTPTCRHSIDSTFHSAWDLQALGGRPAAAGLELR